MNRRGRHMFNLDTSTVGCFEPLLYKFFILFNLFSCTVFTTLYVLLLLFTLLFTLVSILFRKLVTDCFDVGEKSH